MKYIYKIFFSLLLFFFFVLIVYASVTTAIDRKSDLLPWQWSMLFDPSHNVWLWSSWSTVAWETRFVNNWDWTIKDNITWLIWQQIAWVNEMLICSSYDTEENTIDDLYFLWDNAHFCREDPSKPWTWPLVYLDDCNWCAANKYCMELELWWNDDWRLPKAKELHSLLDLSKYNPSIDTNFFSTATWFYWTNWLHSTNNQYSISISFKSWWSYDTEKSNRINSDPDNTRFVRCVR